MKYLKFWPIVLVIALAITFSSRDVSSQGSGGCGWSSIGGCTSSFIDQTCGEGTSAIPCSQICDYEIDLFHGSDWSSPLTSICTGPNAPAITANITVTSNGSNYTVLNGTLPMGANGKSGNISLSPACIPLDPQAVAHPSIHGGVEVKGTPCSANQCSNFSIDPGTTKVSFNGCHMIIQIGAFNDQDRSGNIHCHDCSDCN